jgi:hypothetical protein
MTIAEISSSPKTTASSTYGENLSLFSMKALENGVPSAEVRTSFARSMTTRCPSSR